MASKTSERPRLGSSSVNPDTAIPGPKSYPLIGTAYSLDPRNIVQSGTRLAEKHGRFYRQEIPGSAPFYVVTSFALVDELSDETRFHKVVHPALQEVSGFSGNGLFTAEFDDPEWGKAHRILMPAFSPVALRGMYHRMADIADQLMLKWSRARADEEIDVAGDFTRLTLDTIALCSFTFRFNSFYTEGFHPFIDAMGRGLNHAGKRAHALKIQKTLGLIGNHQFNNDVSVMQDTVDSLIRERRRNPSPEGYEDVLDVMMNATDPETGERLTDENLRYQLITFLIAGHETTSGLLSFVLYELMRNPRVLTKARENTDSVLNGRFPQYEDLKDLNYIDQVLREGLRKYPTAPAYAVTPFETTTIGENGGTGGTPVTVNPGDTLLVLLGHMHRDPAVWDNPEEFRPERFDPENAKLIPHNAWKPFGNGQRSCLGRFFALQEATMMLALIVQHLDFNFANPSYELEMLDGLTSKPKDLFVTIQPREECPYLGPKRYDEPHADAPTTEETPITKVDAPPNGYKLRLLVGSNAGTSRSHAEELAAFAKTQGFEVDMSDLDDAVNSLQGGDIAIVATSSYEGLPPDNAKRFFNWITGKEAPSLTGVKFAVLGSGNSDWAETFQRVPAEIDEAMESRGAIRLIDRGVIDMKGDYFADFESWSKRLWSKLAADLDLSFDDHSKSDFVEVTVVDAGRQNMLVAETDGPFVEAVVTSVQKLSTDVDGTMNEKFKAVLELPEGISYSTGDYLEVLPKNSSSGVNRVLDHFQLAGEDRIKLSGCSTFLPIDQVLTINDLLENYVELATPLSKRHLDLAVAQCQCPPEKAQLSQLAETETYNELLEKRTSLLDFLETFRSVDFTFGQFISMLEPLRARRYSISSSALGEPTKPSLTFSRIESPAWSGRGTFTGVSSNYLAKQQAGSKILVSVVPGNKHFQVEPDPSIPMILIGAGTGIAPLRAFIEERATRCHNEGITPAKSLFFYGCHGPESDFLYSEELHEWEKDGVIDIRTAFSRHHSRSESGTDIKYVQDRLYSDRNDVFNLLEKGAKTLVCGDAKRMAPAVRKTFAKIISEHRGFNEQQAAAEVRNMEQELFTYVTEAFT